jgi:hypothetical protein
MVVADHLRQLFWDSGSCCVAGLQRCAVGVRPVRTVLGRSRTKLGPGSDGQACIVAKPLNGLHQGTAQSQGLLSYRF